MADSKRWRAYIWVTWLTGLLAGSDVCEWKAWYKAHFRFAKFPKAEEGDLDQWKIDHDQMVRARVSSLVALGYNVCVEDENAFKLSGERADLAGKPDIVATKGARRLLVIDAKTGQQKMSDRWQVLVYLWVLDKRIKLLESIEGEVDYRGVTVAVPKPTAEQTAKIVTLLQTVGGDLEPPRKPSAQECKFCDVGECPDRVLVPEPAVIQTTEF